MAAANLEPDRFRYLRGSCGLVFDRRCIGASFARPIAHACYKVEVVRAEIVQLNQSYQKPRSHIRRASDLIAGPDSSNLQEFSPMWISIHRLFLRELLRCLHPT